MSLERYRGVIPEALMAESLEVSEQLRRRFHGRVLWNVNSTAAGGGVAEMHHQHVGYGRGAGLDSRWLVISGDEKFFRITKRIHNALHGTDGDGSNLGDAERRHFERVTADNFNQMRKRVGARDVFILHDPQTAALVPLLAERGHAVIWRCHIGTEYINDNSRIGWRFLEPYITRARAGVFSRADYVPEYFPVHGVRIIPPNIDPFSPKNHEMAPDVVRAILTHCRFLRGGEQYGGAASPGASTGASTGNSADRAARTFTRTDGSQGRVDRAASFVRDGAAPDIGTPLVTQVSRWDRLKDPVGVMTGFEYFVTEGQHDNGCHLVLAGPDCTSVSDDPEGREVFDSVVEAWRRIDDRVRSRVHIASIPMDDMEENAAIVNALQRHSAVVVQKSLQEGFGLTVTEAMWKGRPVLASAVGGIRDQIVNRESGVLLSDPSSSAEFGAALGWLFEDADRSARIGESAREQVRQNFLGLSSLVSWGDLLDEFA